VLELLSGFVEELRSAGLPVSTTEHIDAARAIHHVPIENREELKAALGITLVKSAWHWPTFETAFDVYFANRFNSAEPKETEHLDGAAIEGDGATGKTWLRSHTSAIDGGLDVPSSEELAALLYEALVSGDVGLMRTVARHAVTRYAGVEPGRPVGGTYYLYRTLRKLDLDAVLERLMLTARPSGRPWTALEERLARDEYQFRIDELRKVIEAEIRRRLVLDRGARALAKSIRKPSPEDIEVMHATREELAMLHRALRPLSRKLAAKLVRRRRHGHRGHLDFRATIRRSLSTGGAPIDPRFRHPRPSKPEIVVLADISGSVASFARFTLHLVYAISSQFTRVRSFAFVDGIDEVTRLFEECDDPAESVARISTEADVSWIDGHSDYGHMLVVFSERWRRSITSRTSLLILGDARNNYHATHAEVLADLKRRARHVYWLNPEPREYWDSGDSAISAYAPYCDAVVECRNLRQLEQFVSELA